MAFSVTVSEAPMSPTSTATRRLTTSAIAPTANSDQMARAADLPIQRSRSGAEWGVIGLVIGLMGDLGVSMIRRA